MHSSTPKPQATAQHMTRDRDYIFIVHVHVLYICISIIISPLSNQKKDKLTIKSKVTTKKEEVSKRERHNIQHKYKYNYFEFFLISLPLFRLINCILLYCTYLPLAPIHFTILTNHYLIFFLHHSIKISLIQSTFAIHITKNAHYYIIICLHDILLIRQLCGTVALSYTLKQQIVVSCTIPIELTRHKSPIFLIFFDLTKTTTL